MQRRNPANETKKTFTNILLFGESTALKSKNRKKTAKIVRNFPALLKQ